MRYKFEFEINKPLADVWVAFNNPKILKMWQPSLKKIEQVNGIYGDPNSVADLLFMENEREFTLRSIILKVDPLYRSEILFQNEFAENNVIYIFTQKNDSSTQLVVETTYRFKTFLMKIFGVLMKRNFMRRTWDEMERFKDMLEKS